MTQWPGVGFRWSRERFEDGERIRGRSFGRSGSRSACGRARAPLRCVIACLLVVTTSACTSTTRVRLPSPELSEMNLRAHDTRSTVTLRDGRQLEVDGLQVNVDEGRGVLLRERKVDAQAEAKGEWRVPEGGQKPVAVPSSQIVRVVMRTDKGKGAAIGGVAGTVVGGGIGMGIGYAARPNEPCVGPYQPTECPTTSGLKDLGSTVLGLVVGAVVVGVAGFLLGRRGVERTYELGEETNVARTAQAVDATEASRSTTEESGGTTDAALSLAP